MPTYVLGQYETRQYSDDNGAPLAGGRIAAYLSGTSTPTPTYGNAVGTPNTHPLVLDSAGRGTIYLDTALTYKFLVTDAAGVTIATIDPINPLPLVTPGNVFTVGPGSAAFPGFTFTGDENTGLYGPGADILAVTTGGVERARWGPTGGLNIGGTTDPGDDNLRVEGTLNVQGATTLVGALNVTGPTTLSGGLTGTLTVAGLTVTTLGVTSNLTVSGLATLSSLTVPNATTLSTLEVTNAATIGTTLGVSGTATINTLTVPGVSTLTQATIGALGVTGNLVVSGAATLGSLTVPGASTVSTLAVTNAATIGTTLGVTGATSLSALTVSGLTTLSGNVRIGSPNTTDAVAVPTITSGFGLGATITGRVYAFTIAIAASANLGVVNFNMAFATPPAVVASSNNGTCNVGVTTSQVTIATGGTWVAGDKICVHVRGF